MEGSMMYVHWQPRIKHVIVELPSDSALKLVNDLERLTGDAGYSTKLVEILLANVKEELRRG
jgi:hypothetical protein